MNKFQNFRATQRSQNSNQIHLVTPQINMYNEQLVSLMDSINQELKFIIEDELFDKLSDSIPAVNVLLDLIGKVDVTLSFSSYLRGLPNGIDICRPTII